MYNHDHKYLTNFYHKETKSLMDKGFSKFMVVAFYKSTLDNNAELTKPYDLSSLEELMSKYLLGNHNEKKES